MFVVICPHCGGAVEVVEVNCRIFRHGVFRETFQQIPPHASKEECDAWVAENLVIGCAKPFRLKDDGTPEICDYI